MFIFSVKVIFNGMTGGCLMIEAIERKSLRTQNAALLGIIMGGLIVALDMVPAFNLNSFLFLSFASGTLGIWVFFCIILMLLSDNARQTFRNVLAFLGIMSIVYYVLEAIRDSIVTYQTIQLLSEAEREMLGHNGEFSFICFNWGMMLFWLIISLISAVGMYLIAAAKEKPIIYTTLTAMPLAVMLTEGVKYTVKFCTELKGLAPIICDLLGFVICFICLYETKKRKLLAVPFIVFFSIALHSVIWFNYFFH